MRTVLDDQKGCAGWFLEIFIHRQGTVTFVLAEGIVADAPTPLTVGEVTLQGTRAIEATAKSRRFKVVFEDVVAHHVIEESYTQWDDHELRDGKDQLQVLSRSRFLEFLHAHHGWMFDIEKDLRHFRVCSLDWSIDVVARAEPRIELTPHQPTSEGV